MNREEKVRDAGREGKRPYEKPQIIYRDKLELMAGFCGDTSIAKSNSFACPSPKIVMS